MELADSVSPVLWYEVDRASMSESSPCGAAYPTATPRVGTQVPPLSTRSRAPWSQEESQPGPGVVTAEGALGRLLSAAVGVSR